jgi:hypothetical protein
MIVPQCPALHRGKWKEGREKDLLILRDPIVFLCGGRRQAAAAGRGWSGDMEEPLVVGL